MVSREMVSEYGVSPSGVETLAGASPLAELPATYGLPREVGLGLDPFR
jgi:hypothetical protein